MGAGFVFLPSYYDALRELPDEQRLMMYDAILDYAFQGGKEPDNLPPILNGYFVLLRPNIDNSIKRYSASVENGKKGGRLPKEKPNGNPTETQEKPNGNLEKEYEKETEKEKGRNLNPTLPVRHEHGQFGWVKLSDEEFSRLSTELGESELERCIAYVDESAQSSGNKNRWRDWNLVIRRCHRDGWGLGKGAKKSDEPFVYDPGDKSWSL